MDLSGKTILLTGGTGSFGTAFVERVTSEWPDATIRIYSRDELKQSEMAKRFGDGQLRYFIGDIRNRSRLSRATQGADIVVHAAAMKQVPACEYNPFEAVQTNVLGAQHVVDASIDSGVEKVIALSTDKAVNPVNLYGATKLCEEKIIVQGNAYAAQSRTSLYALDNMVGGEVFIPKIPSMRVTDLAEAMAPGVPVERIGIRPGEKLHEILLTSDESRHSIDAGEVYVVLPEHPWWTDHPRWVDGKPVDGDFTYASDTNDWWLDASELKSYLP